MIEDLQLAEGLTTFGDWWEPGLNKYLSLLSEINRGLSYVVAIGCSLVDAHGKLQAAAWTSDEVLQLEQIQFQDRHGPSIDCYATGEPIVNIHPAEARRRWPTITVKMVQVGFASLHTLPLCVEGRAIGVLSLYTAKQHALTTNELSMCQAWIQAASIELKQSPAQQHAVDRRLSDRYQVEKLLGRGGMANVHLARDTYLDRMVAIKTPRWDRMSHPGLVEQFRREGRAAVGLKHPGIVSILSRGDEEVTDPDGNQVQRPYMVMEYVTGATLQSLVREEAGLAVEKALTITDEILATLSYTHAQGVVHGDLTATNVMLSAEGNVKLMDFGSSHTFTSADSDTTQIISVTPAYGSPERNQGLASDARSDLYSAGCVLYQLLTGRVPFVGDSRVDLAYRHVYEAPQPPSTYRSAIGPHLDTVVMRALAKSPDDRYQSAQAFRQDLLAAGSTRATSV